MLAVLCGAPSAAALELLGVNLAGAEFGIPDMEHGGTHSGQYGRDYTYPTATELDGVAAAGLNVVRIPFSWERMQPKQDAALDPAELGRMDAVVGHAATLGVRVVLDVHNYGYGYGHLVGSAQTPDSSLADLWRRLATHYAQVPNVIYGIMNEPHDQAPEQWLTAANAAIAAIRATGARQEILVPGTFHTNGASWVRQGNSTGFADHVQDPAGNMAFEVHQYNDRNQSGSSTTPLHPMIGAQRLQDVTAWAEAHGHRLFLGEFGAGPEPESLLAMQNQLAFMQAHAAVWQGGTAWSGGPWWPKGNPWALDDVSGVIAPQVRLLQRFVGHH